MVRLQFYELILKLAVFKADLSHDVYNCVAINLPTLPFCNIFQSAGSSFSVSTLQLRPGFIWGGCAASHTHFGAPAE